MQHFPHANVGVLTKLSVVTVIDVDAPELVAEMEQRFGWSPLVAVTPSDGIHLWYRANGESCRNLRGSEGLEVDVKAGGVGRGGFIVVPPPSALAGRMPENSTSLSAADGMTLHGFPPSVREACLARHQKKPARVQLLNP